MKQRIRVVAIIRDDDSRVLLLERAGGRLEGRNNFELPNGKIDFGEQPEEALSRIIHDYIGAKIKAIRLIDVITFTNLRDSSEVSNLYIIFNVTVDRTKVLINPDRHESYRWVTMSDLLQINIDNASQSIIEIINNKESDSGAPAILRVESAPTSDIDASIYTDGGSRGNPGPSAIGYYIVRADGSVLEKNGEFIGITNSRQAEYIALKTGIERAIELGLKTVKFYLDNLMVVNQMNGVYQVKNRDLWPIYDEVKKLLKHLDSYSFTHVKRDRNFEADAEVNRALDKRASESDIL